jgi:hypothetical protein
MAPILGIYASQISGHLFAPSGAYDSIATVTVGSGGSSSVSFTSIPSTYTHLQLRILGRGNRTSYDTESFVLRANSDSGANYATHQLVAVASSVLASGSASTTGASIGRFPSNSITANVFGVAVVDILDYANTNKYKTIRNLGGIEDNDVSGLAELGVYSSLWMNTSAISSLTFTSGGGTLITQYSSFALYGIKGA